MRQTLSKLVCLCCVAGVFSSAAVAEDDCDSMKALYDNEEYVQVVQQYTGQNDDGCVYNVVGLAIEKISTDQASVKKAEEFFSASAGKQFTPGVYNLLRAQYLYSVEPLQSILTGLDAVTQLGIYDEGSRGSASASWHLINRIGEECVLSISFDVCRGRKIARYEYDRIKQSASKNIKEASEYIKNEAKLAKEREGYIWGTLGLVILGVKAYPAVKGGVGNTLYPPKAGGTDPWLWTKPMPPIVTCVGGRCVVQ